MSDHQDNENRDEKAENPETKHNHEHQKEHKVVAETYYDDDDPATNEPWEDEKECWGDKLFNSVVSKVPYEALDHMNKGRKEFVKAGIALAENELRKADNFMDKVKKAHDEKE